MASTRPESPPLRPFEASLPMALLRAREAAMRRFRPLLAEHELTEQQWRVLRALAAAEHPLEVGEVVDRTFLLGPSLSRILANLERRRLVVRSVVDHDQRRSAIALSPPGRALVARVGPRSEAIYAEIEAAFGADRLARLVAEMRDLAAADAGSAPRRSPA